MSRIKCTKIVSNASFKENGLYKENVTRRQLMYLGRVIRKELRESNTPKANRRQEKQRTAANNLLEKIVKWMERQREQGLLSVTKQETVENHNPPRPEWPWIIITMSKIGRFLIMWKCLVFV